MYRRLDGSTTGRADVRDHIEHDRQIPDHIVISSPGGVSAIHHHYTKGLYGRGDNSSDIYGNASNRYISGEYGNIYKSGHSATTNMLADASTTSMAINHIKTPVQPTDGVYWDNTRASNASMSSGHDSSRSRDPNYKQLKETFRYETLSRYNTGPEQDIEYIPLPEEPEPKREPLVKKSKKQKEVEPIPSYPTRSSNSKRIRFNQYLVFFLVIILYISFGFWYDGLVQVLTDKFHRGRTISSGYMIMYGAILTILFFAIIYFADIPLITFEDVA